MCAASAVSTVRIDQSGGRPSASPHAHSHTIGSKIRSQGSACIRILTGNMYPWIRSGDQVFVRRWDFEQILPGDVVLFERSEQFYVHRVIRRDVAADGQRVLITKGDSIDVADDAVNANEFLGRATRIHRGNRHIDIQSLGQRLWSRALARVSKFSWLAYSPLRSLKRIFA